MITFERLEKTRIRAGHSRKEAAEEIGIHLQTYYWWERRGMNPLMKTVEKIEDYLRRFERRRR